MKQFVQQPLLDDPSDSSSATATEELTVDSIDKLLSEDEPTEEPLELDDTEEKTTKKDEKEEDEEDELKLVEDEEENKEDDINLVVPVSKKKILAKYPNIFKDFPYLETAYYADQAYKELLPTIDDAKEVIEKAKVLDGFEQNLIQGNTENLLNSIKQADGKAFAKIIDNYLPTLAKVDKGAFDHVITNVTRQTIMAMVAEARHSNNEELGKAALLLNQFAFGTSQFQQPTKLVNENPQQENETLRERQQFIQERFTVTKEDLDTKLNNTLKSTLHQHIDPKGDMTDYVKKNAVKEALEMTDRVIANDQPFRRQLDALWKRAYERNFDRDSVNKIRSAYLSKAKTVLKPVIAKVRADAIRGLGKKVQDNPKNRVLGNRSDVKQTQTTKSDKNAVPKGMRTIDFLMQD